MFEKKEANTSTGKNKFFIFMSITLLIASVMWFIVSPKLYYIPQNFSYSANLFSLDDFYDETRQIFLGRQISKTIFAYETISAQDDVIIIKNIFDVRKLTGEKIFGVDRIYGIDSKTGAHVEKYGDQNRTGYLFAPKRNNKQDFAYWHVSYDVPALMKFAGEENILGLKVYRYETDYDFDQTAGYEFLPEVPELRGVNLVVQLQLWIEPFTGRIVKHADKGIAYYYDINTRERLFPRNSYENRVAPLSVNENVKIAQKEKLRAILIELVLPFIILVVAMIFFVMGFFKKRWGLNLTFAKLKKILIYIFIFAVAIFVVGLAVKTYTLFSLNGEDKNITIGIANWDVNPDYEQNIEGFKTGLAEKGYIEGKNVNYIVKNANSSYDEQFKILESFNQENVDLIYTLTTRGTLIAKNMIRDIPIVFSVVTYPVESKVIESESSSGNNLVGTRNYVPAYKQYFAFEQIYPDTKTMAFVHRKGEPNSEIQYIEFNNTLAMRGINVLEISAVDIADIAVQLESNVGVIDSVYGSCDTLIQNGGAEPIIDFSMKYKKPTFSCLKDPVVNGMLIGYIAEFHSIGRLAGEKASQILNGAEPRWIATEAPLGPYLIINEKTADALGLEIPYVLRKTSDEIITN